MRASAWSNPAGEVDCSFIPHYTVLARCG
jgi:hypothetical protein